MWGFLLEPWICFETTQMWRLCNIVKVLNAIKLFNSKWLILYPFSSNIRNFVMVCYNYTQQWVSTCSRRQAGMPRKVRPSFQPRNTTGICRMWVAKETFRGLKRAAKGRRDRAEAQKFGKRAPEYRANRECYFSAHLPPPSHPFSYLPQPASLLRPDFEGTGQLPLPGEGSSAGLSWCEPTMGTALPTAPQWDHFPNQARATPGSVCWRWQTTHPPCLLAAPHSEPEVLMV